MSSHSHTPPPPHIPPHIQIHTTPHLLAYIAHLSSTHPGILPPYAMDRIQAIDAAFTRVYRLVPPYRASDAFERTMWLDGLQGEVEDLESEVVRGLVEGVGMANGVVVGSSSPGDGNHAAGLQEEPVGEENIQARIERIKDEVKRLKSEKKGLKKRMKEQEKAGGTAMEMSVRDDEPRDPMQASSPPVVEAVGSAGPHFLQDTVFEPPIEPRRRSHNLSTTVEDGSSSSSREKTLTNPYVSNEPYPPLLPASTRDVRIENADDVEHTQAAASWRHEEEQRRHKFTEPSQDQQPHDEQHQSPSNHLLPGSYIHIALPPRFTFPTLDDSFVVFTPPTSVFHFPGGATREQLLSLLEHRRSVGQTSANGSIVHVHDMGYEIELGDAIAKLLRSQERDGHVPLGDMWEIGQGDTYIVHGTGRRETVDYVSGPEDQEQIADCGGPDMRGGSGSFICPASPSLHDVYFPCSNTPITLEGIEAYPLSTGIPSSTPEDECFAHSNTPITLAGMRVQQSSISTPTSNQADEFKWMQEAHKFQLGWEQLRQLYCNLLHENDSLRQGFQTADKEAADQNDVIQSTLRRLDFWIDEAKNARKREKLLVEYICELERVGQMWMRNTATVDIRGGLSRPESHDSAELDLDDLAQDFKAWKGPPGSGIDGSSTIAKNPNTDEPDTRDVEPLGFYFFPSVSTIVLHTEPLSYIQFPHRVTLTDIRRILAYRKTQGMEDNSVLVRIRDILELRDEMGIPDPELSDDRQILICVPAELEPDTQKPGWDRADEAFQHRYNVLEKQYEADLFRAINVLRGMRGLSYLKSDDLLITRSDSEGEKRYKDIGELINQLNEETSFRSGSDSMWSEQSAVWSSVSEEERRRQLDTAYSRGGGIASPYHIPGTHDQDLTPAPHTVPDMFPTHTSLEWSPVPSEYSGSADTFQHPRGQGCETWAGRLDPTRNQCTYCHLPFAELEPREPLGSHSNTTVSDEDQAPSQRSCLYASPSLTPFADRAESSAETGTMGESFPFKVCMNPYAVPPFSHSNVPPTSSTSPLPFGNPSWAPPTNNANPEPPRDIYRRAAEDSASSDTSSSIYVDSLLSASSTAYISTLLEELTLAEQQQSAVTQSLRDMQDQQKQLREEIEAVKRENEELREGVVQRNVSPLRRARGGGEVRRDVMEFVEYVVPPPSPIAIGLASMAKGRVQATSGPKIEIDKGKAPESASTGNSTGKKPHNRTSSSWVPPTIASSPRPSASIFREQPAIVQYDGPSSPTRGRQTSPSSSRPSTPQSRSRERPTMEQYDEWVREDAYRKAADKDWGVQMYFGSSPPRVRRKSLSQTEEDAHAQAVADAEARREAFEEMFRKHEYRKAADKDWGVKMYDGRMSPPRVRTAAEKARRAEVQARADAEAEARYEAYEEVWRKHEYRKAADKDWGVKMYDGRLSPPRIRTAAESARRAEAQVRAEAESKA